MCCVVELWVLCILKEQGLELNNKNRYSGPKFEPHLHAVGRALARDVAPHISIVQYSSN
jgi:hypothetical protein